MQMTEIVGLCRTSDDPFICKNILLRIAHQLFVVDVGG